MSLEEIKEARLKKFKKADEVFSDVFPARVSRDFSVAEAVTGFSKFSRSKKEFKLCGRIFSVREHGAIIFCNFKDGSFDEKKNETAYFQAFLNSDVLGEEKFSLFSEIIDIGDFIEFKGSFFLTKTKEKTIRVSGWRLISKGMNPLPEKWHGMADVEERLRKRYLDLLSSDEVKKTFFVRAKAINEIRNFLNKNGFLEVETPVLQPVASGALAEPFKTHHNALDADLYLRVAPELYLKKLLIGGLEKVYELGRNFRNEGVDVTHNPEFTMLEFYQAYKDSSFMMKFVEDMVKMIVKKVFGRQVVEYEGEKINFSKKFAVISFFDVIKRHALLGNAETASLEDYRLKASQLGVDFAGSDSKEKIADNLFKKICRPKIIQPTFVVGHPVGLSPLAKKKEDNQELADRFQLVAGKLEIVNAFSELNDPIDQAERFRKQVELKKAGDREALEFDNSFLEAMEYGMPPAVGVGIGIDRLVMLLTQTHNIRDVILFPLLREKK